MAEYPTPQDIAEGCTALVESGCAQRQAIEATKARIESLIDLDVALLALGEELPVRKYGARCDD